MGYAVRYEERGTAYGREGGESWLVLASHSLESGDALALDKASKELEGLANAEGENTTATSLQYRVDAQAASHGPDATLTEPWQLEAALQRR
jgi:hypothetical protein